jgi:hypothetical protein
MFSNSRRISLKPLLMIALIASSVLSIYAQEGVWKDIFNGKDLTGLKQNKNGTVTVNATDKIIEVSGGDGYLYTEAEYTHYRARVEWKNIGGGNTGYLHHIDLNKVNCTWPAGPELQMMKGNVGQIWSTDCKFNSTGTGLQYNSTEPKLTGIGQYGCGRTNFKGTTASEKVGDWNAWEIYVQGDSLEIKVNGAVVMRISKLTTTGNVPMVKGHMALQIEGSKVQWRNWQVMDLTIPTTVLTPSKQGLSSGYFYRSAPNPIFFKRGLPDISSNVGYSALGRSTMLKIGSVK